MKKDAVIYIAGHLGLVGSALVRRLETEGYKHIIKWSHNELDLRDEPRVSRFFESEKPDYVFLAAARVGGIQANIDRPAEFIRDNLLIQTNVIHSASVVGVKRLLFFGSACFYPKECPQPMKEEYIMTGPVEPTSKSYAMAKLAGLEVCEAYRRQCGLDCVCVVPCTLYGPGDNLNPAASHVLSALLVKFHRAREQGESNVALWGTGAPRREFLYVDDLADACLILASAPAAPPVVNVGFGEDISIKELAQLAKKTAGFIGGITWDPAKPDGVYRKLLDSSRIRSLGWQPKISLEEGLKLTYQSMTL